MTRQKYIYIHTHTHSQSPQNLTSLLSYCFAQWRRADKKKHQSHSLGSDFIQEDMNRRTQFLSFCMCGLSTSGTPRSYKLIKIFQRRLSFAYLVCNTSKWQSIIQWRRSIQHQQEGEKNSDRQRQRLYHFSSADVRPPHRSRTSDELYAFLLIHHCTISISGTKLNL